MEFPEETLRNDGETFCNCEHVITDLHAILKTLRRLDLLLDQVIPLMQAYQQSPAAAFGVARKLRRHA